MNEQKAAPPTLSITPKCSELTIDLISVPASSTLRNTTTKSTMWAVALTVTSAAGQLHDSGIKSFSTSVAQPPKRLQATRPSTMPQMELIWLTKPFIHPMMMPSTTSRIIIMSIKLILRY